MTRSSDSIEQNITRQFYDRYKIEHALFVKSILGIADEEIRHWYASVILNRLMFIYFIQSNGYLDNDTNYLRSKLTRSRQIGSDLFYRKLLIQLFFEGFAKKPDERSGVTRKLLGEVPYLNGGLFLRHKIEGQGSRGIQISDIAFEKVFDFFDQYKWQLDEQPLYDDKTINPGVLGYIFEQYINQKQMGAYYTKNDITEYISKNTIIPFLFERVQQKCKGDFEGENSVWRLIQADPNRYIYPVMKMGIEVAQTPEIPYASPDTPKDSERRSLPPEGFGLPTESQREVIARRKRYQEIHTKLVNGEIRNINDLVTYNLNIGQFAQDAIEGYSSSEFLHAFWHTLEQITVLDPTCGSGAFLLAALNILEPLYEACLDRMQILLEQFGRSDSQPTPDNIRNFAKILTRMKGKKRRSNHRYFILKSIIVNNLFGVDIMDEAVEICKLRLFLKLLAQIKPGEQIDPLPDIDFNIRAGNALLGYATYADVESAVGATKKLDFDNDMDRIKTDAEENNQMLVTFRKQQAESEDEIARGSKERLREQLEKLKDNLNRYLADEFSVNPNQKTVYKQWLVSHKPFHWFVDFYWIINNGGFDVIIGNPPYVNASRFRQQYEIENYVTATCPDIYAWVLERTSSLLRTEGRTGMIVPLSVGFSGDFEPCRKLLFAEYGENWFSSFARIPSALFNFDVRVRNTIHIGHKTKRKSFQHTTRLHRWFEAARPYLFDLIEYASFVPKLWQFRIPKLNTTDLANAFEQCLTQTHSTIGFSFLSWSTPYMLHFKKTAYNWLNFCHNLPPCYASNGESIAHTKFGELYFADSKTRDLAFLLLNGKIVFAFWCITGDDFDVTRWMFAEFPIDLNSIPDTTSRDLLRLTKDLEDAMVENLSFKLNAGKKVGNYNLAKCRAITDQSDAIFAEYLGLQEVWTDIELMYSQIVKTDFDVDEEEETVK
jgi:hypothetical protein